MSANCREERSGADVWAAVQGGSDAKVTGDVEAPLKDMSGRSQMSRLEIQGKKIFVTSDERTQAGGRVSFKGNDRRHGADAVHHRVVCWI